MATQPTKQNTNAGPKNRGGRRQRPTSGFDFSARQARIRREEQENAELARGGARQEAEIGNYLRKLAGEYLERDGPGDVAVSDDLQERATKADERAAAPKQRRPRPVTFAGSGLKTTSGAAGGETRIQYRSNEEALPSRFEIRGRNRSPRNKGKGKDKTAAAVSGPEYDATALDFGPSLAPAAAPALPKIWGPGMNPPKPKAAAPRPSTPPTPPPAENDVWGDDSDDDFTPLEEGQAWGTTA